MDTRFVSVEVGLYFMTENNFMQEPVVNTLFQRKMDHFTKRMDPRKHKNWTRTRSYDQLLTW